MRPVSGEADQFVMANSIRNQIAEDYGFFAAKLWQTLPLGKPGPFQAPADLSGEDKIAC